MGGEDGGSGVAERKVDVEKLEQTVRQADVSGSREEAPHFDLKKGADYVVDVHLREYLSEHQDPLPHGPGGSGFYKVPEHLRQQAGTAEAVLLYDPKHVNFPEISALLLKQQTTKEERRQLSHYSYHLHSYASDLRGDQEKLRSRPLKETIEFLMQQMEEYKKNVKNPNQAERQLLWVDPPVSSTVPQSLGLLFAVGFIGDLFRRYAINSISASEDPECAHLWAPDLWSDLLLLENQIPLSCLVGQATDASRLGLNFDFMGSYFEDFVPLNLDKWFHLLNEIDQGGSRIHGRYFHVLHFVHDMLLPDAKDTIGKFSYSCWGFLWSKIRRQPHRLSWEGEKTLSWRVLHVPTVTRLVSAGVQFKPVDDEGFVVEFHKGVLMLPRLHVSHSTKKMLANLVAWEMCHADAPKYFINYVIFMDYLINTAMDVEILIKSKVFEHSLANDDEVKTFFDGLGKGLVYTKPEKHERYDIFPKLTTDINKYYQSRQNAWMANLTQEYFKSPWSIISLVAASVLLVLTVIQTFFDVYDHRKRK